MATSHVGQDATQAGSLAKTRPIPTRPVQALERETRAGVTDHRPAAVGAPTPAEMLQDAVHTALDSLGAVQRHTHDVADAFRFARTAEARSGLVALVENTRTLIELASASARAARLDLAVLCRATDPAADAHLRDALDLIVAAQLAEDWAALAAHLEGPFAEALEAWRRIFDAIARAIGAPGPEGQAA